MFEQSNLLGPAPGKQTVALAASLTAQILAVAVLITLPLIFSDRLPDVRVSTSLLPPLPPASRETPPTSTAKPSSPRPSLAPTKAFMAPRHIADLSKISEINIVDAPLEISGSSSGVGDPIAGVPGGIAVFAPTFHEPAPKPKPVESAQTIDKPLRIGGDVLNAKLLKKVLPVYPPLARQVRVSGTVQLIGVIAKDGTIQQLQVVSGHPLLIKSALDAVRQWIYRPTLLNGQAVEVIAPIDVIVTLSQP
jgi:protein TonB